MTIKKRRWKDMECKSRIKDRGTIQQLHLTKERISGSIFSKTVELEIKKLIVRSSTALRQVSDWTLWRGPPQNERRDVKSTALGTLE
jgi:hypothetical protein